MGLAYCMLCVAFHLDGYNNHLVVPSTPDHALEMIIKATYNKVNTLNK